MSLDAQTILIILGVIISIMMIVAILKIPKIAKYQRATMGLTAYMAKRQGVSEKLIKELLNDAGETIVFGDDE